MVDEINERPADGKPSAAPGSIQDSRVKPRGVLPRHVQMWLMVAIAVVILAIILLTGQSAPLPRSPSSTRPTPPALVPPDRVRSYQQQLAADLAREQQGLPPVPATGRATKSSATGSATAGDPMGEDQRRREYQSLFADNVALSRRPTDRQPYGERRSQEAASSPVAASASPDLALLQQLLNRNPTTAPAPPRLTPATPAAPLSVPPGTPSTADVQPVRGAAPETSSTPKETGPIPAGVGSQRLLEGTVIETVLLNRLDGTFAGPVECLVTTPVYSHDRQSVLIPAGARVLGSASPIQSWGDSRLAVSFHRLVMPDGRTYSLDRFKGLGQVGDTGLKDSVNRHYLQVFGASLAIGALSGLAQYGTRSTVDASGFGDSYRQAAGSSLAASAGRVLDRYLNVLPTITIHEGYRIKVYLTNDFQLPPYPAAPSGGVR